MSFSIRRGMNVGGWLENNRRVGSGRFDGFQEQDVRKLADLGFDHLRMPIEEAEFWDESGKHHSQPWDLLEAALDWCQKAGMKAVIDLHRLRDHYFNAPERPLFSDPGAPARFAALWDELSKAFCHHPLDQVAFELLNEAVADHHGDWNRTYVFPYRAIRQREPQRAIVLGSNLWNQAYTFEFLEIPAGDPHLILTFHYYYPMFVTHYRASWVKECASYDGPVQYPGLPIPQEVFDTLDPERQRLMAKWNKYHDRKVMSSDLLWPLAVAYRTRLPLYCGEFGVIHHTPGPFRDAWHREVIEVLEERGIGWANWSYQGRFGFFSPDGSLPPWLAEFLKRG